MNIALLLLLAALAVPAFAKKKDENIHRESMDALSCKYESDLRCRGAIFEHTALNDYLNSILRSLASTTPNSEKYHVEILKSSDFNAFAMPNGSIYIGIPLLAVMENEAQLAALLSHEMVHIQNDHAARSLLNTKKRALSSTHLRIGLDFVLGSLAGSLGGITFKAAITGYSRDLEREADSIGLITMTSAGYAPIEFRNLFMILEERLKQDKIKQPFFFATHPAVTERINNYYALAGSDTISTSEGTIKEMEFSDNIAPILLYEGKLNIASGSLDKADTVISRVTHRDSCNSEALFLQGVSRRLRASPAIDREAVLCFNKALDCNPTFVDALREQAFIYYKLGETDSASLYLSRYKEIAPTSPYLPLIEEYLRRCEK